MRVGRFTMPEQWARDFALEAKLVMSKCIVVRAEMLFHSRQIEYMAVSEHFRDLPDGEVAPAYVWKFSEQDGVWAEAVDD